MKLTIKLYNDVTTKKKLYKGGDFYKVSLSEAKEILEYEPNAFNIVEPLEKFNTRLDGILKKLKQLEKKLDIE